MAKKKMSLALQIFIALVLAIIVGMILGTNGAAFAGKYPMFFSCSTQQKN